ncbi:MAG: restriction endonuclease subunit S [Veillonella sp.]|nr:restriction endonuclease subunit S [Veillonella sp.]
MKCKLGEIVDVIMGQSPKSEFYNTEEKGYPFLQGNRTFGLKYPTFDIYTMVLTKLAKAGDIIMSVRAPVGDLNITPVDMCLGRGVCALRMKNGNQSFLFYLMKYYVPHLLQKESGTVFGSVNKRDITELEVDIIEAINNNLEQQAQAIFKTEFLSLKALPSGWRQASLIDIADYLNGLAMQKYRPSGNEIGIPVLKIKELRQGCCDNNSELCSPNIKNEYIIHDGDVIFSWSGSLLVDFWCGGISGLNQHLFKVTSSKYDKWFYYAWTKHHLDHFIYIATDKATTMGHIKRDELAKAEVFIPHEADYRRIGALLQPI